MSKETTTILRSVLYQALCAEDKEDYITAIEAICSDDDISAVRAKFEANQKRKTKTENKV
jgi:hypothetical protein